jgi:AraC-like DNA-binding protein
MFKSRKTLFGILVIVVFGVVVALGLAAFSSRLSLAASSPEATQTPSNTPTDGNNGATQYLDTFLQALATRLNVSVDTLKQALAGAGSDTLDQAVKDGRLTQAEADQLKTRITDWINSGMNGIPFGPMGPMMGLGHHGRGGFFGWGYNTSTLLDEVAKALGMDQQSLVTELQNGKSIADVAQEHNVDIQQLKQTVLNAMKASLDDAVKNSKLTQIQADQIYQSLSNKIDDLINQKWTGDKTDRHDWPNWGWGG